MPTHRLIEKSAGTGERATALDHFGFRVWMQYQLSADDFGVCPAEAFKLQGENLALQRESSADVQAQIEILITSGLCGVFLDGTRRYLYQQDWQDYQRIKHPSKTALPPIPESLLVQCSSNTQQLFREHHQKSRGTFSPHANAYANANAYATANATADDRFERFWNSYPRKVGKGAALALWRRLNPTDAVTDQMIAAVETQKTSSQWRKKGGEFIPHPRTWLHQGRWQDQADDHAEGDSLDGLREFVHG